MGSLLTRQIAYLSEGRTSGGAALDALIEENRRFSRWGVEYLRPPSGAPRKSVEIRTGLAHRTVSEDF